jgi:TM2 domain-containing membrane protein YozV
MEKYLISTFCSAFIVPGLGQIINGQIKKGLIHIGIIFVLLFALVFKLTKIIMAILPGLDPEKVNVEIIRGKIDYMDYYLLRLIAFAFIILWLYSIIDAFIVGLKFEKGKRKDI